MAVVFAAGAAVALLVAWLIDRRRRVYADLGTTPAAAVYAGRNEVKGRAWHTQPLPSHITDTPCVRWTYTLEEERVHTRTVTETDSKGNTRTRTETYHQWHEIDRLGEGHPAIEVVDDSGSVTVVLGPASVTDREIFSETFREEDRRGFFEKLFTADNRTGRYRRVERGIAVGDDLFVVGEASLPDDDPRPRLDHGDPFVVSTRTEESHRRWLGFFVPVFLLVAAAFGGLAGNEASPGAGAAIGVAVVGLLILSGALLVIFNRLQLLVQQAARAWSLIDIQLTRRHSLIPRLANIARAATDHERVVLESAAIVRSSLIDDAPDQATVDRADREAREQTDRLRGLFAVIEDYPDLKAGEAMADFQAELADTENRIAGTRTFYNEAVTILRNRRGTFPGILVARYADPRRFALFAADGFERTVPPVVFEFPEAPARA